MTVLIAPDKFKDSLSALEVCEAIERGCKKFDPQIETVLAPMADGGDGSLDLIERYIDGERMTVLVKDPLGRSINACYFLSQEAAYIEMSAASGLMLLAPTERNPLYTSTFGTGELVLDAISHGAKSIYLFLGGSATNDMGIGMAEALGYKFLDKDKEQVPSVGIGLGFIMDIRRKLKYDREHVKFFAVCDVDNPLYGKKGAAHVYAAQKGAGKYAREILDKGLRKMSKKCNKLLQRDVAKIKGAGAAGGLGAGILAFLDGSILPGAQFMLDVTNFENELVRADLVITGEGKVDNQTLSGKLVSGILSKAHKANKSTAVLCGKSDLVTEGISRLNPQIVKCIVDIAANEEDAKINASLYLEQMAFELMREVS